MDEEITTSLSGLKLSKYNSAADQLERIGGLWRDANNHSRQGNYDAWNMDLDAVWRELAGDLPDNSEQEKYFDRLIAEISLLMPLRSAKPESFNKNNTIDYPTRIKQYRLLMKKEIFLRRMQNNLGKGSAYKDEFEDDFE